MRIGLPLVMGIGALSCSGSSDPKVNRANPIGLFESQKDLILITVDTLRADRLPFYGADRDTGGSPDSPWTPSWMANHGTVLEHVYAQVGITLPSLSSMWTGQHPLVHGALTNHSRLEPSTFAMDLEEAGWTGIGAVANGILRSGSGLERGFRDYLAFSADREQEIPQFLLDKAHDLVKEKRPLLMWAHFMAPHQPYSPPKDFASRYSQGPGPSGDNQTLYALHANPGSLTPEIKTHLQGLYDAEVFAAGEYTRQLLTGLDEKYREAGRGGLLDNAVVVFTSDHGEELGDRHGFFMHAKSLYSGVTHVPAIILGANWPTQRDSRLLGLQKILPWILTGTPPHRGVCYLFAKGKILCHP